MQELVVHYHAIKDYLVRASTAGLHTSVVLILTMMKYVP